MDEIWQGQDRFERKVTLTPQRQEHIFIEHSDMEDRLDYVRLTVEQPNFVTRDRRYPHRENFYRSEPAGSRWIEVVVHYRPVPPQGTWEGEVITAYHLKRRKIKEVPLWP